VPDTIDDMLRELETLQLAVPEVYLRTFSDGLPADSCCSVAPAPCSDATTIASMDLNQSQNYLLFSKVVLFLDIRGISMK